MSIRFVKCDFYKRFNPCRVSTRSFYLSVRPSVCIKQHDNNSKNVDEILNRIVLQKFFDVYVFCLKSDKSNGHFVSETACLSLPISRRTAKCLSERDIPYFSHQPCTTAQHTCYSSPARGRTQETGSQHTFCTKYKYFTCCFWVT